MRRSIFGTVFLVAALTGMVRADEGMWTFNNFPAAKVTAAYGFTPSTAFLDHVRKASARIAGGCSASFISPQGLVMTNHHCVQACVGQLSSAGHDFEQNGFYAKRIEDEQICPAFEIDELMQIDDVTAQIEAATAGKTGDAANRAIRAASAKAQEVCGSDRGIRCDVVSLYHGGIYDLYRYHRYTDVRLIFAPEYAVAQFGGDPDNFNFPRFDYDIGVLRVYENGKPAATPDYFRWSPKGSRSGDLVFVSGNPANTSRELTVAQLTYARDVSLPIRIPVLAELRGILEEFALRGPEQARECRELTFSIENSYKGLRGRQNALDDPAFFATKVDQEQRLRSAVAAQPSLRAAYGSAWDEIAAVQTVRRHLAPRLNELDGVFGDGLLGYAGLLVQAAAERKKPNGERLDGFTDQGLVRVEQRLEAAVPVYPNLAQTRLDFTFQQVREQLGADDPLTKAILGKESPADLAQRLVMGTKLGDPTVRKVLFAGGQAAIDASVDPMIVYARALVPTYDAAIKDFDAQVTAPTRVAAERIAKARFAIYGTNIDPDATFTARLSYGSVKGFDNNGTAVAPYTTIGGLFGRATGSEPYQLPASWLAAQPSLSQATPMNFVSTNDTIGGNSGSPAIDKNGEIVGLFFDTNIYALGGEYGYDGTRNRAVFVDSRALLLGLRNVYHADRVAEEIEAARH